MKRALLAAVALLLPLAACASDADENTIRFALDWTPNTNHTGLYVAIEKGYFEEAGLEVEILPYNQTGANQIMDAGHAEFGVSFHPSSIVAQSTGADVITVLAPLQNWATAIGVRADDDSIQRPADLDGTTYAGFGSPWEEPMLQAVIQADGGAGEFETIMLDTMAYEALYSGDVDVTIPFFAWEGIEAEHRGTPFKYFHYTDYGFPESYAVVINARRSWAEDNPEQAEAFVQALQRGYAYAVENPEEAAQILLDAAPDAFDSDDLVFESQRMLSDGYMTAPDGSIGTLDLDQWAEFGRFMYEAGLLVDENGDALESEPDWSAQFTNDYLSLD